MAGIPLRRRRGPMSAAQKAALKKAQEISARKRRGTGKPDEPSRPRPTAQDYRAKGRQMAQKDGVAPGSTARKVRIASRANATGGGGRSGNERTKFDARSGNQTATRFTPKQRANAVRKAAGITKKPSAPQYPNEGPSPVVRKRRKAQPKDVMKPTAGDGKTKYQYNPDLSVAENMRLQKEFDAKKNAPKPQKPSSTTGSNKPRGKDTKFDDLAPSEKKKLSSIADTIRKINDEIVGSKNMTYTADALQTFSGDDPNAPGNDQTLQDFVDGIDEAIAEMDDLWQGSSQERAARKKLTTLKGEVQSMMLVSDGQSTEPPRAKANAPKASGGSKPAMGTADPGTMGVSQILKERKELIAKRNSEGLSKEEAARLVAIQAESALRHQNRKAGKGTGPTKVALGDKGNISQRPDTPLQKKMDTAKKSKPATPDTGNISQRPDNPDQKDAKDLTDQELKNRLQKLDDLDKQLMARKRKYANDPEELAAIKKRRDRINAQWDEAALEQKKRDEQKKSPDIKKLRADYIKARDSQQPKAVVDKAKRLFDIALEKQRQESGNRLDYKGQKTTDNTKLSDLKSKDVEEVSALRASMLQIADKDLMRDNVSSALKAAGTIGDLVEAAKDIYWYLDEWDGMGRNTSELRREMDRTVEKLKKYSDSLKKGK